MAVRILSFGATKNMVHWRPFGSCGAHDTVRSIIGNREIVGFGVNGQPEYVDNPGYPMPSIRWKETTPDIAALREKEKGDWRKLTIQEKKALYRASFCQTFSEFHAHSGVSSGDWKSVIGCGFLFAAFGVWLYLLQAMFVYSQQPLPNSFSEESKRAQLRRMFDARINVITGIASKWDFEKDVWKK